MSTIFISGATGYLGRPLTESLVQSGHDVRALARPQSIRKLPLGCKPIPGNALEVATFGEAVPSGAIFVHLTGVAHPSPSKTALFRSVDLAAFEASLAAAQLANVQHFVYVSVAQPAPVMRDYIAIRRQCEERLNASGVNASILRPWYVLGPGHRWPYLLQPFYWVARQIPFFRLPAARLGLITREEMIAGLLHAISNTPAGTVLYDVPAIRALSRATTVASPSLRSSSSRRS